MLKEIMPEINKDRKLGKQPKIKLNHLFKTLTLVSIFLTTYIIKGTIQNMRANQAKNSEVSFPFLAKE